MGFGILTVGYLVTFLMSLNGFGWIIRLPGYALMLAGCVKLRDYFPVFRLTSAAVILMTVSDLFGTFAEKAAPALFPAAAWTADAVSMNAAVYLTLELVFHLVLIRCVRTAAEAVELKKPADTAVADFCTVIFCYLLRILTYFLPEAGPVSVLGRIVMSVIILFMLLGCYKNICPEGDEDMPVKPSRFAFINRMREITEKREQNAKESAEKLLSSKKTSDSGRRHKKKK